ncbi:RICIN domain-containing protein [Myceligenerans indicum]|uniref:F5/8 type C domain-containing protein n=1 Tax=Myceligenerans indicum TaxID=2593663 RepID=A0ABS1LEU1_9MICO|nr:glycoside hydrolase [Myceligenerans indicum]MBL0884776.1 hypothetical protein [Myceligenerans indicum]
MLTSRASRPWLAIPAAIALTAATAGGLAVAEPAPPSADAVETVTVRPDPSYAGGEWEGWGSSLVWSANATGDYPDEIRDRLVDLTYGHDGLNLNIARYNIGGGNAPGVRDDYMKTGATMPGWWQAPEGIGVDDRDWWDPDNPDDWNWDADANQRWWVDAIKGNVTRWEAFSNSPPWFQTVSGYVSGGFDGNDEQLRQDTLDDFATYLVRVMEHVEEAHGIEFDTVNPLNEPNTNYWSTTLGADGQPVGGRQEGAHAGPERQAEAVEALAAELAKPGTSTDAKISAPDETNPGKFLSDWRGWSDAARDSVAQLNVHTYGTGQRTGARDVAKGAAKPLWMSEVEGNWGPPSDYETMAPGLGIADRITDDLRELEPTAWVLWQPIEDYDAQIAGGGNWGSIQVPFSCDADDTLETCPIRLNSKFDTIRNFTHYITPGDHLVATNDTDSTAAVRGDGTGVTLVHVNPRQDARAVTIDLSGFRDISSGATVTPVVTSAAGALVAGEPVAVSGTSATLEVPGESVTTFLVDGVSGVARDAALAQDGHAYRFVGAASGLALAPGDDGGLVIRDTAGSDRDQLWTLERVRDAYGRGVGHRPVESHRAWYDVVNVATGERLAVRDGDLVTEAPSAGTDGPGTGRRPAPDAAASWMLSTTGDGSYTLVNVATGLLPDVWGDARSDGAKVGLYTPTAGSNQRWTVFDETPSGTVPVDLFTVPGLAPELPESVTGVFRDGERGELPVTWDDVDPSAWDETGTVEVAGTAVGPDGSRVPAVAEVLVDTIDTTEPATARTYAGGEPELPGTVTGVGATGIRVELPVTWGPGGPYDVVGTVVVDGEATLPDGATIAATAEVTVTEPETGNLATADGVTVSSTYTEPGYSEAGLRNGVFEEKAWSNWRSGTKNPSDTLTFELGKDRDVTGAVVHFWRDGGNRSWAETVRVEVRDGSGVWVPAGPEVAVDGDVDGHPVTEVVLGETIRTDAVRVILDQFDGGYTTAGEVEILGLVPAQG